MHRRLFHRRVPIQGVTAVALAAALLMLPLLPGPALAAGEFVAYKQGSRTRPLAGATVKPEPMTVFPSTSEGLTGAIFVLDGSTVLKDRQAPFEYTFAPTAGQHTVVVKVQTSEGASYDLPAATFATQGSTPPPPPPPSSFCVEGERVVTELIVAAGTTCEFSPTVSSTLHVRGGSILVEGVLRMRPANPGITHRIVFEDITDTWVGGGMGPADAGDPILDTDPGLWCMRACVLDLQGSPRTGWTRSPATAIGWGSTDEVRIAPTAPGDFESRPWKLGDPVPRAFPDVPAAEVANLTRNVVIGGTPGGETHVFIRSDKPQTIRYARFEHAGPDCTNCRGREQDERYIDDPIGFVTGRWALHFHMMDSDSVDSLVEGVVVAHAPGRGFVPHKSHGVTFRDTVAYDVTGNSYWWDTPNIAGLENAATDHTLYDHALSLDSLGSAFLLGHQNEILSNVILDSAVAGTEDNPNNGLNNPTSAIEWQSTGNPQWTIDGFIAHNNIRNLYSWNNERITTEPFDNVTFYNGQRSLVQGAYGAHRLYKNLLIRGDTFEWHTSAGQLAASSFVSGLDGFDIDVRGRGESGLSITGGHLDGEGPDRFHDGAIKGYTGPYAVSGEIQTLPRELDFVRVVTKDGTEMDPADVNITRKPPNGSLNCEIRIQQSDGDAWRISYFGAGGPLMRTVTKIAPFAP